MPDYDPEPIPNIVIHPGDTLTVIRYHHPDWGSDECRLTDRRGAHYATLDGHHTPEGDFVIDAIRFVSSGGRVLPVRAQPHTESQPQPNTNALTRSDSNSINVSVTPFTYIGDPPLAAATTAVDIPVTISHYHEHAHTHPDDPFRFAFRHSHSHDHTGSGGNVWLSEHVGSVHDHDHTDGTTHPVDSPEQYPDA